METSNLLSDGSGSRKDVKLVRGNRGMNSLHIRMCPCKDVMVASKDILYALSLFLCHEGTDVHEVIIFF